jgi:hypothetical protein
MQMAAAIPRADSLEQTSHQQGGHTPARRRWQFDLIWRRDGGGKPRAASHVECGALLAKRTAQLFIRFLIVLE